MKDMEWVLPNPLVDMRVEDLANLWCQLKNVAKNLADLLLHEWPSALDIMNELHRLQEAVDEYSLNRIWFSTHARVDGTVMMITTPEICRVSLMIFDNATPTLWMIVMHSIYYRKLCGPSLAVLIPPILNERQTVWIGSPQSMMGMSFDARQTCCNSRNFSITTTFFARMSMIYTKNGHM